MPTLLHTEFLADICQHPGDDTPRLIYADWLKEHDAWTWEIVLGHVVHHPQADGPRLLAAHWLDEHGDPERSEFIRVQCELVRRTASCSVCNRIAGSDPNRCVPCTRLRRRERELLRRYWSDWLVRLDNCYRACGNREAWPGNVVGPSPEHVVMTFRRGFVAEVTLTTKDFLRHARALFRAAPLTKVVLSDREPWYPYPPEEDCCWWFRGCGLGASPEESNALPAELFDLLHGEPQGRMGEEVKVFRGEDSQQAGDIAREALSAAALLWGRRQAWPCPRCEGDGWAHGSDRPFEWSADVDYLKCPICKGTGHTVKEG
jgi:uncharacterized protein (TIGR02996 family)